MDDETKIIIKCIVCDKKTTIKKKDLYQKIEGWYYLGNELYSCQECDVVVK